MALTAGMSGKHHVSKRGVATSAGGSFGSDLRLGTLSNIEARVSNASAVPVGEAKEFVGQQAIAHADETRRKVAGKRAWMWVVPPRWSRSSSLASAMAPKLQRNCWARLWRFLCLALLVRVHLGQGSQATTVLGAPHEGPDEGRGAGPPVPEVPDPILECLQETF